MKHKVYVSLSIDSFEDIMHDDITNALSLKPSKIHIKGQLINPNFALIAKRNAWFADADGYGAESFDYQTASIITILNNNDMVFREYSEKYSIMLVCAIYLSIGSEESTPPAFFEKHTLQIFAKYNLEIDFDLYMLP